MTPQVCRDLKDRSEDGVAVVSSVDIAGMFGRSHRNVLRDIDKLLADPNLGAAAELTGSELSASTEPRPNMGRTALRSERCGVVPGDRLCRRER